MIFKLLKYQICENAGFSLDDVWGPFAQRQNFDAEDAKVSTGAPQFIHFELKCI